MVLVTEKSFLKLGRIRFANHNDVDAIEKLVDVECNNVFHLSNIHRLIEISVLNLCQLDSAEQVIGFICLNSFPNISFLHPGGWEDYFWRHFKVTNMRAQNTLFAHLFCWDPRYSKTIVKEMLKSVYLNNAYIDYIVIVMPPGGSKTIQAGYNMEMMFNRIMEFKRGMKSTELQYLYVAERKKIKPRLRIRKAVEEDNDDLVPIIDRQSDRLKRLYGDYYISELIARHPESERALLVAEANQVAIGVMCLNTLINYELLNESFHLEIFWGLRKQTITETKEYQSRKGTHKVNEEQEEHKFTGKVNSVEESSDKELFSTANTSNSNGESTILQYNKSYEELWKTILSQDDDFEFGIVNIDKDELKVPSFLRYENFQSPSLNEEISGEEYSDFVCSSESTSEEEEVLESYDANDIPTFSGRGNAFVIELFAIHEDFDERYGFDILEVAFEIYPKLDYCILALPTSHTVYPLLEHFTFVSPRACQCKFVSQALYIAHRNSVCGKINVRCSELADLETVTQLLSQLSYTSEELTEIFTSRLMQSFVIETERKPVGFAVISPMECAIYNRTRYQLTNLIQIRYMEKDDSSLSGQGALKIMVISPIVQPHANFFLREIFRLSGLVGLVWLCSPREVDFLGRDAISLIGEMMTVVPQKCIQYHPEVIKAFKILKQITLNRAPYSMWYTTPRLTSLPKIDINHSIVIVGASRTALIFIEKLLFGPSSTHTNFTNITLISNINLWQYDENTLLGATLMSPVTLVRSVVSKFSDRFINSIPIQYLINSITAVMVEINRDEKYIVLSNGNRKYYDELFLMCGLQYQHPDYLKELLPMDTGFKQETAPDCLHTRMDDPKYKEIFFATEYFTPENLFIINSVYDAKVAIQYTLQNIKNVLDCNVVVYGYTIHAYCCLSGLLAEGIPPTRITFVEPFPCGRKENYHVSYFNNEYVDKMINDTIEELGIRIYRSYYLAKSEKEWFTYSNNKLKTVKFISHQKLLELECIAFFYYGVQGVNINAFIALNKCGIVYDGGVIINDKFETNDSNIHCAGTMSKYKRMYYSNTYNQVHYNYEDVGFALGEIVRKKLDPLMNPEESTETSMSLASVTPEEHTFKLPKFESPVTMEAVLPGGLHYLNLREPGPDIPLEVHIHQERYGRVYVTNKSGYFRLHFSDKNKVCRITCLSKKKFNSKNIMTLYGCHEKLLNNFMAHFAANKIDDLFAYFEQKWIYALYHEFYHVCSYEVNNVLPPAVKGMAETLVKIIADTLVFTNKPGSVTEESRKSCISKYKDLGYEDEVTRMIVQWLSQYSETLPFYAVPDFVSFVRAEVYISLGLK